MTRFYFYLWFSWIFRVTLCSLIFAGLFSLLITISLYIYQGFENVDSSLILALKEIFIFWFMILWNVTLLLALFRSLKYIFNVCYNGYKLELYNCQKDKIFHLGYGDLVKVWRKWIMILIWLVGVEMVFMVILSYILNLSSWFNIYLMYSFVLLAGYFSFYLLVSRCKQVKIVKC